MTALREVFQIGKGIDGWSTDLHNLCWAIQKGRPISCPIILPINFPEKITCTTFPGSRINSSPVERFLA
jgi:hypothetical protein